MGTNYIRCEVFFRHSEVGDSSSRKVTLRWPLFVQVGHTAEKIGEVTATVHPRGVIWKELQDHIQKNLSNHLQSNYDTYLERRRFKELIPYVIPSKFVHMLTVDIIKMIPKHRKNPRCANIISTFSPEVEASQEEANLAIKQHCDPYLNKIIQAALEKGIKEGSPWSIKESEFKMEDHVL